MSLEVSRRVSERRMVCFGSSRIGESDPAFALGLRVGAVLARNGWTVLSGGYAGAMEAVSRGARGAGGRAIGVTTPIFADREPNAHLDAVWSEPDYPARLAALCRQGHGFLALPGGLGTLSEWTTVWCLLSIGQVAGPLYLFEDPWRGIFEPILALPEVGEVRAGLLHWLGDAGDLDRALAARTAGG
jgi:uncharacterized protein (TIGR00730 family)